LWNKSNKVWTYEKDDEYDILDKDSKFPMGNVYWHVIRAAGDMVIIGDEIIYMWADGFIGMKLPRKIYYLMEQIYSCLPKEANRTGDRWGELNSIWISGDRRGASAGGKKKYFIAPISTNRPRTFRNRI